MASNPLSAKKTRAAVAHHATVLADTIDQTNAQRAVIVKLGVDLNVIGGRVDEAGYRLHTFVGRGFRSRFRWLFLGK